MTLPTFNKDEILSTLIGDIYTTYSKPKNEYFTIAELNTIEKNGLKITSDLNTGLVSESLIKKIKPSQVNPYINRTGVNYRKDFIYNPSFSLYVSESPGLKNIQPLVMTWCSGNHTTIQIDQGFLSTFELTPRLLQHEILWDDLKRPESEIVKNKLMSEYEFPTHSEAYVKVKKEYLERYLFLRKKKALQIFNVQKEILIDNAINFLLNGKQYYIEEFKQHEIRITAFPHKEEMAMLEINGFQILSLDLDIDSKKTDTSKGHYWKGIEGLVTAGRARHKMPFEHIYVSDKVLEKYENNEQYQVSPQSGSVAYRNQWSVTHCERVGKNAIKIEIKKLYEGNRLETINYWNQFSIHPDDIVEGEGISVKAERLTKKYFLFGKLFSSLLNHYFKTEYCSSDIITLDENEILYNGWANFLDYKPITHIVDLNSFPKEQFISRCKKLYILLGENLQQKPLRKLIDYLGFPHENTKDFRSLRLLELILKYLCVSYDSGLNLSSYKESLIERISELKEFNVLSPLFALNDIRQLDAHKSNGSKGKLENALLHFSIEPNSISGNYADACFQVYDSLINMFTDLNTKLSELYNMEKRLS